jgi:hypothetical protein
LATYGLEQRKQRWCDFLSMDKPAQHVFMIGVEDGKVPARPWPRWDNVPQRIEWAWDAYRRKMERMELYADDTVPFLHVYTGTEIYAEAFGCGVAYPEDNMPFARPLVDNAVDAAKIKVPRLEDTPLMRLLDIGDELRRRAGGKAVMGIVDIQSPMDIAAQIWDKNTFFIAMLECPEAVWELAGKVGELFCAFFDEWFRRYGRDFIAHYPSYYMPRGLTLSEDEVGSINVEVFLELFLPELVELSNRYGGLGMHCCATARHQWEHFLKIPDLRLLNLVHNKEYLAEAYQFFGPHTAQMHCWCGDGEPEQWLRLYPPGARVVLQPTAKSEDDARRVSERLCKLLNR